MVKADVPVLTECALSPPYEAVIVTEVGGLEDGVYKTEHVLEVRLQDDGLNVPPVLPSVQVTMPDGAVGKLDVSVTDAVNCTWDPWFIATALGVTVVVVLGNRFTDNVNVPAFDLAL
jgi:hypothetical protein